MSIIPFSNVETKELKLTLLVARIGLIFGLLWSIVVLYFAFYEMFFEITSMSWSSDEGEKISRGRGILAFTNYWTSFIVGLFTIFFSSTLAVLISLHTKCSAKNT